MASTFLFSSLEKIIPDAYHGTLESNVASILKDGFKPSQGEKLHLGSGVYFYEGSLQSAWDWAKRRAIEAGPGARPAALRCQIRLGRCIDLANIEHLKLLARFGKELERRTRSPNFEGKVDKITEAFILNLAAQRSNADTVRAPYALVGPVPMLHKWSQFNISTRLVICVRNVKCIQSTIVEPQIDK